MGFCFVWGFLQFCFGFFAVLFVCLFVLLVRLFVCSFVFFEQAPSISLSIM